MELEIERAIAFFRFEDLRIYHKSLDYSDFVYEKINSFPGGESNAIAIRLLNAAQTISIHIAEGSARNKSQFVYYLKMAKSSVRECLTHTTSAEKQSLLTKSEVEESRYLLMEMTKMIGALSSAIRQSSSITNKETD